MRKLFQRLSLKYQYLLSSSGVVLIACAVLGLLLYFGSVEELRNINEQQVLDKLTLFATDVEMQQKALADVSYTLATEVYYKRFYFERNAYYEIELFKEFVKFRNNSQIIDDYFLMYHGGEMVYKSTGAKNSFNVFANSYGLGANTGELYAAVQHVTKFTILKSNRGPLFAWPVYTQGRTDASGYATVAFFISAQKLSSRARMHIGELGEASLFISRTGDAPFLVLGADAPLEWDLTPIEQNAIAAGKDGGLTYSAISDDGLFTVMLHAPDGFFAKELKTFSIVNMVYLSLVIIMLLGLAGIIGYYNYRPIQRLSKKYNAPSHTQAGENELRNVELLFDAVLSEKKDIEANLLLQYDMTKKNILQLLIGGDQRYAHLVTRPFMGIHLPGPLYGAIAIELEEPLDDAQEAALATLVEDLADEDMHLHFVQMQQERHIAIFVSARDEDMLVDAIDYVKTLFVDQHCKAIGVSAPFEDLADVQEAFTFASFLCSQKRIEKEGVSLPGEDDTTTLWYDAELFDRILAALEVGNYQDAIFLFHLFADSTAAYTKSFLFERLTYHNILYRLDAFARAHGVALRTGLIHAIVKAESRQELFAHFDALIRYLCDNPDAPALQALEEKKGSGRIGEVLDFIREHYANSMLSLDMLSEHFGLSNRYISNMIKEETGLSYKEFLTNLRIKQAQYFLLTQKLTVTQTCECVGYTHLPHFIKTFKRITGFTPSNYNQTRAHIRSDSSDNQ